MSLLEPLESDPDDDRDDLDWERSFTLADNAAATTAAFERSKFNFALEFVVGGGGFCADFLIIPGEGGRTSFCLRGLGAGGFMRSALSLAAFFSD